MVMISKRLQLNQMQPRLVSNYCNLQISHAFTTHLYSTLSKHK